jgi:tetratricopeptide (TPR) repeat protein
MSRLRSIYGIALGLSVSAPLALTAQDLPDKFSNLQSLPKAISKPDLVAAMRGFSLSLGVRCPYCHAAGPTPGSMDFASDEKAPKRTARIMLRMTEDINRNYIAGVAQPPPTVECVTCHRGSANPRTLQAILSETLEKSDLAATVTQYRQLRKDNYGNGKFDFSEATLNLMSESLLKKSKTREAAGLMELNAELNPLTRWGYGVLAMAHQANQDSDKAELDFEKILELNPNDAWASGQLKSIRAARQPK